MANSKPPKGEEPSAKGAKPAVSRHSEPPTPANDAGEFVFGGAYQPASLERWATFPCWQAHEAASVTCGFDPDVIQLAEPEELEAQPDALAEIEYRESLFQRSIKMKMIDEHFEPIDALQILDDRNCKYPPTLKQIASDVPRFSREASPSEAETSDNTGANDNQRQEPKSIAQFTSKSGRTKVINLYQKMLLALSLDYLELVPERPQNPTAKRILQAMGNHFEDLPDEDTVRDHIGRWINGHLER